MERAQLLKEARLKMRLTRERVADHLGVDPTTVTRWENGASTPQPINLFHLCKLYSVTPQELGFDEVPPPEEPPVVTQTTTIPDTDDDDSLLSAFRKQDLTLCLMRIVWNWSFHNARYHELQMILLQELEDNSRMDEQISRRDALRRLALLPIEMYGLSAQTAVLKRPVEEILTHCAAGITACWSLRKGKELAFANAVVSKYIPTLKEIAQSASPPLRKAAAELLVQCFLLKSALSWHITGTSEAIFFAQQAELYGKTAENAMFQILALRTQAATHAYAERWDLALQLAGKARYLLETSHDVPIPQLVHSYVYAGLATYQSYHGKTQDAVASLKKAHMLFFAQSPNEAPPVWVDHNQGNLILNDGLAHHYLGLHKEALDSLGQINAMKGKSETNRVESLTNQVMAEVSRDDQPRDMEWCIDLWIQGIEGARMLQSSQRYKEAIHAYTALRAAWPGEKRIKELREHIVL